MGRFEAAARWAMGGDLLGRSGAWLAVLPALLAGCGGCSGSSTVREMRWPASPAYDLADVLEATAAAEGEPDYLLPDGRLREVPERGARSPARGVEATSYTSQGLYVAEVILGEVIDEDEVALPLVVMLHGRGDRPRVPGGPFGRVPTPMRVLVPRGPLALGDGYAWARYSVTQPRQAEIAADLIAVADRLAALIAQVQAEDAVAGTVIITGFSQGAMLAWTTALRHPDLVGLALPMAGWVPPAARPEPVPPIRVRSVHGVDDPIVRIEPTRELVSLLRGEGADVELVEFPGVEHVVSPEMNARFELWLEEALSERAPGLREGPGAAGVDPDVVDRYGPPEVIDDGVAVGAPLPLEVPRED